MISILLHLLVVAPTMYMLATNQFPEEYKKWIIVAVCVMVVYYLHLLAGRPFERFNSVCADDYDTVCGTRVHHIRMLDSSPGFDRPHISIKSGDAVVWTNVGELRHSITEQNSRFSSGYLYPGNSYSVRLTKKGVYDYRCDTHSGWMVGRIVVE